MCRFNMSFNDAVVDEMRPHFADEKVCWYGCRQGLSG